MRRALSWLGLLLLVASAVGLHFSRGPAGPARTVAAPAVLKHESLSLVILDAGHGGQDSGAMCGTVLEKDLTLDVAKRADRLLRAQGFRTVLTRSDDTYISLEERTTIANKQNDAVFVSVHFNRAKPERASGVETYYAARQILSAPSPWAWLAFVQPVKLPGLNDGSQSLAGFIQDALVARTQAVNRGTKQEQFYVIANVWHPAALVEGGFMTNKSDAGKLANGNYREQLATAISEGVVRYRELNRQKARTLASVGPE